MRDYEEKSFYEIQLDNKQLILVFLAGVTVCVLVFILGVMVGKGRKEAEFAAASRNESPAVRPEPDLSPPPEIQPVRPAKKEKVDKKQNEAASKSENVGAEYLDLEKDTENSLVKDPSKSKKEETKVASKEEPKAVAKEPTKEQAKVETKIPETKPAPEVTKPAVGEPEPEEEAAPALKESGRYTVQVMATSSKPKAEAQLAALQSKGYTAFMNEEKAVGNSVFKVRVGKFGDADTARKTAARLKQELQLETWVAILD